VTVVGLHEVVMTAEVPLTDPYPLLLVGVVVTVSPAPLTEDEEEYVLLLLVG